MCIYGIGDFRDDEIVDFWFCAVVVGCLTVCVDLWECGSVFLKSRKFMSKKEIEAWKTKVSKEKTIFVANKVREVHPVIDKMVNHLFEIDHIQYIRVAQNDLHASNCIAMRGKTKIPISTPGHPTAIGIHLIMDIPYSTIQFYEITSAIKGYGERMVMAILKSIPKDWDVLVVMDWSGGFWDRMAKKYKNIIIS